jgi:hypothetical protein
MDASDWSEEDRQAFVIADNAGFGAWDWDCLANEWDAGLLDSMCVFPELVDVGEIIEQVAIDDIISKSETFIKIITDILSKYAQHFEKSGLEKANAYIAAEEKIIEIHKATDYFVS